MGRSSRMLLALVPLLISQVFAVMALFPKERGKAWRETSATFMFCAVPASIALVGQTYHISNDFQAFQTLWFILVLPFMYLLKSKLTAILAMMLAVSMATLHQGEYWLCAASLIPFHFLKEPCGRDQSSTAIGWIFALGLSFSIFVTQVEFLDEQIYSLLVFMSGASVIYFLGGFSEPNREFWRRPFTNIGAVSIALNLIMYTFSDVWSAYKSANAMALAQIVSYESFLILLACVGLAWVYRSRRIDLLPLGSCLLFALIIMLIPIGGWQADLLVLAANFIVLALGVWYLWLGISQHSTSRMNFGLTLIMILILLRFFDQDFSFIFKGIAFIIVGSAFIGVNVWQNQRSNA